MRSSVVEGTVAGRPRPWPPCSPRPIPSKPPPLWAAARSLAQRGRLEVDVDGVGDTGPDDDDRSDPLAHVGLTPREVDVLQLVVRGHTNRQIAEDLYISDKTASVHVTNVLRKLGVDSRFAAADLARRVGWEAPSQGG